MDTLALSKPRLGFAGVGWIGRNRLQAAAASGLAEIVMLNDISDECLSNAAAISPNSHTTTLFSDMAGNDGIDAVVIATPSAMHMDQALEAFANGKSVFCQKPLGRNAAEVATMIRAAEEAGRHLGADFSYRHTRAFREILELIHHEKLGRIFSFDLKFHNAYGPDKKWFYSKELSGGGCVLDLGIHLIDLLLLALDFPVLTTLRSRLFCGGHMMHSRNQVEDCANMYMEFENGVSGHMSCSWNLHAGREAVIEASFYGTGGGAIFRNVNGSFYDFTAAYFQGTATHILVNPPDDWSGRALVEWIRELSRGMHFRDSSWQYLKSAEIADMIYQSV